jgi:transporter family-2 protein
VLGGLGSAVYITATILLFPRLGAVVSVGLFIVGQMLTSLALDWFGLLGVLPRPMGLGDVLGSVLLLGAAAIVVRAQGRAEGLQGTQARGEVRASLIGLAVLAGAALPIQGAVNALLRADLGVPIATSAVSFVVATASLALLLVPAVALGGEPMPQIKPLTRVPWWGWLGGICGAVYVTAVFTAMPVLGAAIVIGVTVAGQQVAAVLFDRYGLMRLPRRPITRLRLVGVALLLAGMALIQIT